MRIGITLQSLDPTWGGIGIYTEEIVKALLRFDSRNEYVLMYPGFGAPRKLFGRYRRFKNAIEVETEHSRFPSGWYWDQRVVPGVAKQYGDIEAGSPTGDQPNTGYDEWDGDLKIVHDLDEKRRVVVAYQHVRQEDVPRTHATVFARSFAGSAVGSEAPCALTAVTAMRTLFSGPLPGVGTAHGEKAQSTVSTTEPSDARVTVARNVSIGALLALPGDQATSTRRSPYDCTRRSVTGSGTSCTEMRTDAQT